jgi:hypothetical protein
MKIGICGTGRMGAAIAHRVLALGQDLTVWNRNTAKATPLVDAGARHAGSPAALVAACDVIIVMLLNDAAMQAVYNGDNGLLRAELTGKLVIDMSTVLPETMIELGNAVIKAGGGFVECPVGGTVGPARDGKLFGFAGGTEADFARALPLLGLRRHGEARRQPAAAGLSAGAGGVADIVSIDRSVRGAHDRHTLRYAGHATGDEDARRRHRQATRHRRTRRDPVLGERRQKGSADRGQLCCRIGCHAAAGRQRRCGVRRCRSSRARRQRRHQQHSCLLVVPHMTETRWTGISHD